MNVIIVMRRGTGRRNIWSFAVFSS